MRGGEVMAVVRGGTHLLDEAALLGALHGLLGQKVCARGAGGLVTEQLDRTRVDLCHKDMPGKW
jgi:hypothetical protein